MMKYLRKIGYNIKTNVFFMPVSALSGSGLKDRISESECIVDTKVHRY